ncbi:MAG: hypothetical protein AB1567_07205, partial [bacterium]
MRNKTITEEIKTKESMKDSIIKNERERLVWFDAREFQDKNDKVLLALQNTIFDTWVIKPSQIADISTISSRIKLVVFVEKIDELSKIKPEYAVASENPKILDKVTEHERKTALIITI